MNIVIQLPEYVHVMVLARVMVLAYDIGPRLACVIVLACVMVLAYDICPSLCYCISLCYGVSLCYSVGPCYVTFAWITQPERLKGSKDKVKRPEGPPARS